MHTLRSINSSSVSMMVSQPVLFDSEGSFATKIDFTFLCISLLKAISMIPFKEEFNITPIYDIANNI